MHILFIHSSSYCLIHPFTHYLHSSSFNTDKFDARDEIDLASNINFFVGNFSY